MIGFASFRKMYPLREGVILGICLLIGAVVSIAIGQDANWDLRNYHLSTAVAVLRGALDNDFFMSGLQSYFNPTLDIPYAWLATGPLADCPRLLAGFMGLWYGGLIFMVLRIAGLLLSELPLSKVWVVLGTLVAVTGAATFSQAGTTMGEIPVALLVLWGFLILLKDVPFASGGNSKSFVWAGLLFGMAAGLKLTVCIYALALCLALFSVMPLRQWLRACVMFSAAWLVGFMTFFAWWGAQIWLRFDSPTFPLFNHLFKSPFYPPQNFFDARFFPRDCEQWLFYPYYWITDNIGLVSEDPFRDPRFAIAMTVLLIVGLLSFVPRKWGQGVMTPQQRLTCFFVCVSYVVWLLTTSILRYAVTIEILSALLSLSFLPLLVKFLPHQPQRNIVTLVLGFLISAGCLLQTRAMDWGHIPYGETVFDVDMTNTQPDTLFVSITGPTAYLSAFVPADRHAQFVGFSFTTIEAKDWPLMEETKEIITTHQGPIVVLVPAGMADFIKNLPLVGLSESVSDCHAIHSNLDAAYGAPIVACTARKI